MSFPLGEKKWSWEWRAFLVPFLWQNMISYHIWSSAEVLWFGCRGFTEEWRILIIAIHGTSGPSSCGVYMWIFSERKRAVGFENVCKCFYYFSGFCFRFNRVASENHNQLSNILTYSPAVDWVKIANLKRANMEWIFTHTTGSIKWSTLFSFLSWENNET